MGNNLKQQKPRAISRVVHSSGVGEEIKFALVLPHEEAGCTICTWCCCGSEPQFLEIRSLQAALESMRSMVLACAVARGTWKLVMI